MAIFSNQATLTLDGVSIDSNIAYGEILEVLSASKTALETSYTAGGGITYVLALRNTGTSALTGLTVSDDLGGYTLNETTVYPLSYVDGSAVMYTNGVLQPAPTVSAGPPLSFGGITVPAGGDVVIVYQTRANAWADPTLQGTVVNTASVTGGGLSEAVTASETLAAEAAPRLTITKTIAPSQVSDNEQVTYTFVISNTGNTAVVTTDNAVITDTFSPVLTDLTVTFDGTVWQAGTDYTYDLTTGQFATIPGNLLIPAASFSQDVTTGAYVITPGIATLVITGTI